ncbi:hydrogenase formation protein HypD [Dehalococcoidia bacterium]|nr:hydrogenase formation protein HypD [Dehalococcoidia bacterium]MCL0104686.1 hydrogenase formation protein HypD [Dehalococcoidia bacterium]
MKLTSEFRRSELAQGLVSRIHRRSKAPARLMEFCGGHTVAILKHGIRQLLPPTIEMLSGPGCPVCVTANADLDKAMALAKVPGVILATFGDMLKIPGSNSSLQEAKAEGADVRIVYSTMDGLDIARQNPEKSVVFLGIGFETTAPTLAASVLQAEQEGIENYYILSQHKLCPPVTRALLDSGEVKLQGIVCPGHVSVIIGSRSWEFIPRDYGIPCVVSGFEPLDILQCIDMLLTQIESGISTVEIAYRRGVRPEGNQTAQELMKEVFEPCPTSWRGVGIVPQSGLRLRERYRRFDAELAFDFDPGPTKEHQGCICGEILRGVKTPRDCPLFAKVCNPEQPVGSCMVSSEGSCAAYYLYGLDR